MHASTTPDSASAPTASGPRLASGVAVITGAKLWFVISGYAIYFGLTRLLGPERFGLYAVVISIVSVLNNVLIAASLQTVARFVARDADRAGAVLAQAMRVQLFVGGGLFAGLVIAAPWIGAWFHDPELVAPLRVAASIVLAYALYAVNVGFLNGRRRFPRQATLDATYSTLKLAFVVGAVALGFGVMGAAAGFALAAFSVLGLSFIALAREEKPGGAFDPRELFRFGGWLLGLTLLANLVLSADLWVIKRLAPPATANETAGLYRAALTLSQLLYQMLIPLVLVVFPNLARLGDKADPTVARGILRGAMRYLAVTLLPGAALLAVMGPDLVAMLYGEAYRAGGAWLVWLGPAYAAWTVAYLLASALAGAGHPREGVLTLALAFAGQVGVGALAFGAYGPAGAALGDVAGMTLGLGVGLLIATRRFGAILPWPSIARGLALAGLLAGIAWVWPATGVLLIVKLVVLGLAGLATLAATGELPWPKRAPAAGRA
jgi:O-antigen/teichoic acid export membrane protein